MILSKYAFSTLEMNRLVIPQWATTKSRKSSVVDFRPGSEFSSVVGKPMFKVVAFVHSTLLLT